MNKIIVLLLLVFMLLTYHPHVQAKFYEDDKATLSGPDILFPGPDTENFPISPFCLPQGRIYFENFPLDFDLYKYTEEHTYYWPYLLRFGLGHHCELRFTGQGLTAQALSQQKKTGFWPLEISFKAHLCGDPDIYWIPSVGIETSLVTKIASKNFRIGTQFTCNALFFHSFSKQLSLEWNIGTYSIPILHKQKRKFLALITWALEYDISDNIGLFFEGWYNSHYFPQYPDSFLLGAGFISNLTKRVCIYGSYNWQVLKHGADLANLGFAVAF